MSALKKWIEVFRPPPDRQDEQNDVEPLPYPVEPFQGVADQALDNALDDVMARFPTALEHLSR
jgi:hypothetical protein